MCGVQRLISRGSGSPDSFPGWGHPGLPVSRESLAPSSKGEGVWVPCALWEAGCGSKLAHTGHSSLYFPGEDRISFRVTLGSPFSSYIERKPEIFQKLSSLEKEHNASSSVSILVATHPVLDSWWQRQVGHLGT